MKVLLHADGGAGVGLGHASRCATLARALAANGHTAEIVVDASAQLLDFFSRLQVSVTVGEITPHGLRNSAWRPDAFVIDTYRWSEADFAGLRGAVRVVVAFDDEAKRFLDVDAIINGAPAARSLSYARPPHTLLWLGPDYQVVREEFRNAPARRRAGAVRRIIALVGGDDPLQVLPVLAERLDRLDAGGKIRVDLICGPYARVPHLSEFPRVTLAVHPADLYERMVAADLAVSAAGQTLYELARCGTPTVAFMTGADQEHNLSALSEAGIVRSIGAAGSPGWVERLERAVLALAADSLERDRMASRAQALIDGRAAERLALGIEKLVQERR